MADPLPRLSTEELRRRVGDGRTHVVDVRPVDAYNGWRLRGEVRGGHIAGARSLPFKRISSPSTRCHRGRA